MAAVAAAAAAPFYWEPFFSSFVSRTPPFALCDAEKSTLPGENLKMKKGAIPRFDANKLLFSLGIR